MAQTLLLKGCAIVVFCISGVCEATLCASTQYLKMGETGYLKCLFPENVSSVLWYNSKFTESDEPVVHFYFQDNNKGGPGLTSGEYDVTNDGSLVIHNVSLRHEHHFTAAHIQPGVPDIITTEVSVIVTVNPAIPYTVICNDVGNAGNTSFRRVYKPFLACSVDNVRPAISLTWNIITKGAKHELITNHTLKQAKNLYSTSVSTSNVFVYSSHLSLLVCKADSPPGILRGEESLILVQNGNMNLGSVKPIMKHVERGSRLELACTDNEMSFLVWKKNTLWNKLDKVVLYAVFLTKNFTRINIEGYEMGSSGTLVFPQVNVHHEGLYRCISGNGVDDNISAHEIIVYANPVPPHTVVEGCKHAQYCNLEADDEGTLACTVKGIRPKAQLEFKTFHESDSSLITFINQQMVSKDNGETFDLTLTTEYRVRDKSAEQLAIECKVSGLNENVFNITRVKVNLGFKREEARVESCSRTLLVLILATNIIMLLIFTVYFGKKFFER